MKEWKEVSEVEMRQYIIGCPRKLDFNTCFIIEPPKATSNEVIDGKAVPVAQCGTECGTTSMKP